MPRRRAEDEGTGALPTGAAEKPAGAQGNRLPIEDDPSAVSIALRKRGYDVGPSVVKGWAQGPLHVVAMWLEGQLSEDDIPEAIKRFGPSKETKALVEAIKDESVSAAAVKETAREVAKTFEKVERRIEAFAGTAELGEILTLDKVVVTWGEEVFYPVPNSYMKFAVGPFVAEAQLKPNENRVAAMRRLYSELREFAAEVHEQKRVEFLRKVRGIKADSETAKAEKKE